MGEFLGGGCQKLQTRTDSSRVTTNIYLEPTRVLPPVRTQGFGLRLDNKTEERVLLHAAAAAAAGNLLLQRPDQCSIRLKIHVLFII